MHFKEYFSTFYQQAKDLFPAWHVSPWVKIGAMVGMVLGLAIVINAILFLVKPEWYDNSKAKKDKPKPMPHKGISQKIKEGIALTKLEKAEVGYVQFLAMLGQFVGAILVFCGIAGATMALMPVVFNWSINFATKFALSTMPGISPPSPILTGVVYVFVGLAPTGFCLIGFTFAVLLMVKILEPINICAWFEENDDKQ